MSAGAASPICEASACHSTAARTGSTCPTPIRVARLTPHRGIDVYPAPQSQKVRIGLRYAREGELEDFLTAQVRAIRAIDDAARKADIPCEQVMPNDLADWRGTVEFVLGPYNCAKDLAQVSSFDFAKAAERNAAAFCKQGFGTLLLGLAQGLNIQLATPAKTIDTRGSVSVDTAKGTINANAAIVTVPTNVVASGGLRIHARPRPSPDRRLRPHVARQLRSYRARTQRQSART